MPPSTRRPREALLPAVLALAIACVLLVGESLLPGRLFLPLTPDDFPEWQAGRSDAVLQRHPHPNWCMSDVIHLLVPGLAVSASAASRGELPLWDDSQALGVPHLHQVHYGVLYPPAWLPLALGFRGLAWMALLHVLVAALGTLAYLNAIGRTRTAAIAGALCFALSAWVTARLHSFPVAGAAVWLPWVLWGLERGNQRGGARYRLASAAALALSFFAGFPQITLWVLALAALMELARAVAARRRGRPALQPLLVGAATLAFGVMLALPQVLPTLDYLRTDSLRNPQSPEVIAQDGLPLPMLWHLLVPDRYATASLTGANPLALGAMEQARNPVALNRAETSLGVGAIGLLLALLAMLYGRGWRTITFGLVTLCVLVVLLWPGLLRVAASAFPLLRFGSPRRLLVLSTFALSVLAAGGLDLARGRRMAVTVTAWLLAVGLVVAGLVSRLTIPSTSLPTDVDRWAQHLATSLHQPGLTAQALLEMVPVDNFLVAAAAAARDSVVVIVAGVFALLMFRPRRQRTAEGWITRARRAPSLLVFALGAELFLAGFPMLRAAPSAAVTNRPDRIGWMRAPVFASSLRDTRDSAQGALVPPRIARFGDDPPWLRPNLPGLFGLADLQCYAPMAPRRAVELVRALDPAIAFTGSALGGFRTPAALESPLVDLLGVRALLTSDATLQAAGWRERSRTGPVRVLQNDEAFPRAFVVSRTEVVADSAERLRRLVAPDFDPRALALLEEPLPAPASAQGPAPGTEPPPAARAVTVESWRPGAVLLRVGPGEPGLLVVSEAWNAGWRATVAPVSGAAGGEAADVPVVPADHALLALPLPSRYDLVVTLRFQPPLVPAALLLGGALWAATLVVFLRGRRAAEPAPARAEPEPAPGPREPSRA